MWENAKNILRRQIFRFIFHYNYFYKPVLMTSSCKKFPVAVWTDRDLHQIALRVPGWMCLPCIVASQQDVVRAWTGKRREWRAAFVRKAVFRVGKSRGKMGNAKGGEKVIDSMKVTAADLVALFMKKLMVHIYVDKSWTLTRKNFVFTQSSGHIFFLAKISRRRLMGMNFSYIAN